MLDIKWIRENPKKFDELIVKRGIHPMSEEIAKLDEEKRQRITLIEELQQARNKKSKKIAEVDRDGPLFQTLKTDVVHINEKLEQLIKTLDDNYKLQEMLDTLPNLPADDVPAGSSESDNQVLKKYGKADHRLHDKHHFELGESLNMMEFAQTSKISGSRFVTLTRDLAKLERALVNFMIDIHTKQFGYVEISPPYLVRPDAMYNVGQLPKFTEDSFLTTDNYRLIPTAEVPLTNMVYDSIIDKKMLPIKYVAHTQCFRSEAGSSGRDTRGMIRMHQFSKVELVTITTPSESTHEHEFMLNAAEEILRMLQLPYRVVLLCAGEMGFASKKTYDIEVWLPGQNAYREISSCSNCGDFQARRMRARYKEYGAKEMTFVHTLNGSALPIGRTIIAILENYQNPDGSITVPEKLLSYMGGITKIEMLKT